MPRHYIASIAPRCYDRRFRSNQDEEWGETIITAIVESMTITSGFSQKSSQQKLCVFAGGEVGRIGECVCWWGGGGGVVLCV